MKRRTWKRTGAAVCIAAMLVGMVVAAPKEAKAAASVQDEVKYVEVENDTFQLLINAQKAPVYDQTDANGYGYLFGGWYKAADEETAITSAEEAGGDAVYAKYVPAYVMGIKCQNGADTQKGEPARMRVISSVDSARYQKVGMAVRKITLDGNGNFVTKVDVKNDAEAKAYSGKFIVTDAEGEEQGYTPKQVFGAKAQYFTAVRLTNISDFDTIICVRPYWITLDGTRVDGLSRYVRVNDGEKGYVSIPVNVRNEAGVAAGVLTIDYSALAKDGYTLDAVEGGTVFEETESRIDEAGGTVRFVGNVKDISKNAASDDILLSLRFKVSGDQSRTYAENGFYSLTVRDTDFANTDEKQLEKYQVWNVQY